MPEWRSAAHLTIISSMYQVQAYSYQDGDRYLTSALQRVERGACNVRASTWQQEDAIALCPRYTVRTDRERQCWSMKLVEHRSVGLGLRKCRETSVVWQCFTCQHKQRPEPVPCELKRAGLTIRGQLEADCCPQDHAIEYHAHAGTSSSPIAHPDSTHSRQHTLQQMAAMLPSGGGANQSANPYEHYDAPVDDDLIDPDDGTLLPPLPNPSNYS